MDRQALVILQCNGEDPLVKDRIVQGTVVIGYDDRVGTCIIVHIALQYLGADAVQLYVHRVYRIANGNEGSIYHLLCIIARGIACVPTNKAVCRQRLAGWAFIAGGAAAYAISTCAAMKTGYIVTCVLHTGCIKNSRHYGGE